MESYILILININESKKVKHVTTQYLHQHIFKVINIIHFVSMCMVKHD
jgi:hypothetical protein